jgi:4-hydroxy-3-methylbut-2-enyl diphosphate reductase
MTVECYLLSPRGFCSGVTRAVNMARQSVKLYGTVYVVEDVIHNRSFMKSIKSNGVIKVSSVEDIPDGSIFMLSVHGTSPEIVERAEEKGLTVIDGTCSTIRDLQSSISNAAENGSKIVVIGDRAHPEVRSFIGYAGKSSIYVVLNNADVELLPDFAGDDVLYYMQTTLNHEVVESLIESLKKKIPHIKPGAASGICRAVMERQTAIKEISGTVDLVIIIGSSYSSNAKGLDELARSKGAKNVIMVDSKDDLNLDIMEGVSTIAIASAASCQESAIEDLVKFLQDNLDITFKEFSIKEYETDS